MRWRILHELVGRPLDSPAVRRARGGANVTPVLARLLADLDADGRWARPIPRWRRYTGSVWRLLTAVGLGADPTDPRLQRSAEGLLGELDEEGAFDPANPSPPEPCVVARILEGLSQLGLGRDLRFQHALAWLEENSGAGSSQRGWWCSHAAHQVAGGCAITAVATARALLHCGEARRVELANRAQAVVRDFLAVGVGRRALTRWGHPNFLRTDLVEMLHLLAAAQTSYHPVMRAALVVVQQGQDENAWWRLRHPAPRVDPSSNAARSLGERSPWVTLRASVALLRYAPEASLPRRFPRKP